MQQLILVFHVLIAVCLITLVLIQHGKGADIGASFGGGSSNTMFGSAGPAPFLMKVTIGLAALFFITSISLGYLVSHQSVQPDTISSPISTTSTDPIPTSNSGEE